MDPAPIIAAVIGVVGAVGGAWIVSAPSRREIRALGDNVGRSNGRGPVTQMSSDTLSSLERIEGQMEDVLRWQGEHTAEHMRSRHN